MKKKIALYNARIRTERFFLKIANDSIPLSLSLFSGETADTHKGKNFGEIYNKEPGQNQSWYFVMFFVKNASRIKKKHCTTDFALERGFVTLTAVKAVRDCVRMKDANILFFYLELV